MKYYGFSTVSSNSQKKFVLVDKDLIKQDLLNSLFTHQGSRVGIPSYGCIIWNKLFNNISTTDIEDISSNIQSIINSDPRISLLNIDITPNNQTQSLVVTLNVKYNSTNETEQLIINFNNELQND